MRTLFTVSVCFGCLMTSPAARLLAGDVKATEPVTGSQSETVCWQFVLQMRHDKPLVVEGRVLDPAGEPLGEAHIAVIARCVEPGPPVPPQLLGQATTDSNGRFHLSGPSLSLYQCERLYAVAGRTGYGLSVANLDAAALKHEVTFRLREEQPIRGRLTGPDGTPATGVQVYLHGFAELLPAGPSLHIAEFWTPETRPLAWPEPATSDDRGRFVIRGIPRSAMPRLCLTFLIDDPRFAPHNPNFISAAERRRQREFVIPSDGSEEISIRLDAPRIVEGRVVRRDTKEPLADAWVGVILSDIDWTGDCHWVGPWVRTDRHGRFRSRCRDGTHLTIYVFPPLGVPYPSWVEESAPWPSDILHKEVTVEVPRGILVRGKVVEADSGVPVAGASVKYLLCRRLNPYYKRLFPYQVFWAAEDRRILTDGDGSFRIAVIPGPGHLTVRAPTPGFVSQYVSMGQLQDGIPSSFWFVIDGLARIDPKPGTEGIDLTIRLRRGLPVRGRVVGPQGQAVERADLLKSSPRFSACDKPDAGNWTYPVQSGRFELPDCDPARPDLVHFLDVEHQLGATVTVNAKAQRGPLSVRLLPCGSAAVRFVDENNRPWADHVLQGEDPSMYVDLVFTDREVNLEAWLDDTPHIRVEMDRLDPSRHRHLRTDAEGRATFPTLIPGAPYMLFVREPSGHWKEGEPEVREIEFTVEPGRTTDLGEIVVRRPKS